MSIAFNTSSTKDKNNQPSTALNASVAPKNENIYDDSSAVSSTKKLAKAAKHYEESSAFNTSLSPRKAKNYEPSSVFNTSAAPKNSNIYDDSSAVSSTKKLAKAAKHYEKSSEFNTSLSPRKAKNYEPSTVFDTSVSPKNANIYDDSSAVSSTKKSTKVLHRDKNTAVTKINDEVSESEFMTEKYSTDVKETKPAATYMGNLKGTVRNEKVIHFSHFLEPPSRKNTSHHRTLGQL